MRVVELTHRITCATRVYPGTPPVSVKTSAAMPERGHRELALQLTTHTGTHVDAPAHMLLDGATLDEYPAEAFLGRALTVDVRPYAGAATEAGGIPPEALDCVRDGFAGVDFVFLLTGHGDRYDTDGYFEAWPTLSPRLAERLAALDIIGIGVDVPSVDCLGSPEMPAHKALMRAGKLIYESLNNLEQTLGRVFTMAALPLFVEKADGAPVRAVAIIDDGRGFRLGGQP